MATDGQLFDNFSLLYPGGRFSQSQAAASELSPAAWHDLGLDQIVPAFTVNRDHQKEIQKILARLIHAPEVLDYRQQILDDLLKHPELADQFVELLPAIDALTGYSFHLENEKGLNLLHEVTWRVGELQNIIDCIEAISRILLAAQATLSSQGLRDLLAAVQQIQATPVYQNLVKELPELLSTLRVCASVTVGINLDILLRPFEVTLLSINDKPFTDKSLLNKLFSLAVGIPSDNDGIAPLHAVPQGLDKSSGVPVSRNSGWELSPMLVPLFADLSKLLEKSTRPVVNRLKQYATGQGKLFVNLRQGLIFYLSAVRFVRNLQAQGLPVCRPSIVPWDERLCQVQESYNANLALQRGSQSSAKNPPTSTILNDIDIGAGGRILILTGPNQGGKTTYMVGVGLVQVLAQTGCFVPGQGARISPVDNIFTHFPIEEKPEKETGRLGEEALRLGKIFEQVTRHSLVLLNETFSSTNFTEGLYLAQDVVRILRRIGARVIYSTHLYELGDRAEELNQSVPGDSRIISVVSSPVENGSPAAPAGLTRSYKVEIRPPLGQSYAREIAARYGIHYEQLEKALSERGVLSTSK
jgi:DNA mismatch repair protein MutS